MKKILHGLQFDTEKAICIVVHEERKPPTLDWWRAELYVTKRAKRYFLAGSGGPLSRFGQAEGNNSWEDGADIIPLTDVGAREFANQYLNGDIPEAEK